MTIRVLVADDQSMVRAGFRMLLAGNPDIEVVAEACNGLEAVEIARRLHPTVVLMDIRMPVLDGLEATRRLLDAGSARILILTTFDLDEYVYEALAAGASGFVLKDDPPEQLITAIRTVAAGEALLSPTITARVIKQFTRMPRATPMGCSSRSLTLEPPGPWNESFVSAVTSGDVLYEVRFPHCGWVGPCGPGGLVGTPPHAPRHGCGD
jgi:DNA-binding NarL/FixJ family response regulator